MKNFYRKIVPKVLGMLPIVGILLAFGFTENVGAKPTVQIGTIYSPHASNEVTLWEKVASSENMTSEEVTTVVSPSSTYKASDLKYIDMRAYDVSLGGSAMSGSCTYTLEGSTNGTSWTPVFDTYMQADTSDGGTHYMSTRGNINRVYMKDLSYTYYRVRFKATYGCRKNNTFKIVGCTGQNTAYNGDTGRVPIYQTRTGSNYERSVLYLTPNSSPSTDNISTIYLTPTGSSSWTGCFVLYGSNSFTPCAQPWNVIKTAPSGWTKIDGWGDLNGTSSKGGVAQSTWKNQSKTINTADYGYKYYMIQTMGCDTNFKTEVKVETPVTPRYTLTIKNPTGPGTSSNTIERDKGGTYTLSTPSSSDYDFDGWTSKTGTSWSGNTYTFGSDGSVTASWKAKTPKYTLTVNTNNATSYSGSGSYQKEEGQTVTLPTPSRTGYSFSYWSWSNSYGSGSTYRFYSNGTATAQWTRNAPTLSSSPSNQTYNYGGRATFTASFSGADSYYWQYRTSSSGSWSNYTSGSGYTSTSLTIPVQNDLSMDGYQFRCVGHNDGGDTPSNPATLTANASSFKPSFSSSLT